MTKDLPSPELLRKLLRYEPETGKLFWRERLPDSFLNSNKSIEHQCRIWNSKYAGKEAFTATCKYGHKRGCVSGVGLLAHRVIWAIVYGDWPQSLVDHRDMDPANNKLENLRSATKRENACNRRASGASKYLGVCWHKKAKKWKAAISVYNKSIYLGLFDSEVAAANAYDKAAARIHKDFARLNFLKNEL